MLSRLSNCTVKADVNICEIFCARVFVIHKLFLFFSFCLGVFSVNVYSQHKLPIKDPISYLRLCCLLISPFINCDIFHFCEHTISLKGHFVGIETYIR